MPRCDMGVGKQRDSAEIKQQSRIESDLKDEKIRRQCRSCSDVRDVVL